MVHNNHIMVYITPDVMTTDGHNCIVFVFLFLFFISDANSIRLFIIIYFYLVLNKYTTVVDKINNK